MVVRRVSGHIWRFVDDGQICVAVDYFYIQWHRTNLGRRFGREVTQCDCITEVKYLANGYSLPVHYKSVLIAFESRQQACGHMQFAAQQLIQSPS